MRTSHRFCSLIFALSGHHDGNDGFLVIAKISAENLSEINLDGFVIAIHELSAWVQFHFELDLTVGLFVEHILFARLIKDLLCSSN